MAAGLEEGYEVIEIINIEDEKYAPEISPGQAPWPLFLASSGGNGHISAINALIEFLSSLYNLTFLDYEPTSYAEKKSTLAKFGIFFASKMKYLSYFQKLAQLLDLPIIPTKIELDKAIEELRAVSKKFIDVLLDIFPTGYESAAIWNIYQRNDQKDELLKLIRLQKHNDKMFEETVHKHYLKLLTDAHNTGRAYTEVISTQVMGLGALCNAVAQFNKDFNANVIVHQYITDLPDGAIHFFQPLANLTPEQQNLIKLYAVNLKAENIEQFFPQGQYFRGLYRISPTDNPMVRAGFKNSAKDNSQNIDKEIRLEPAGSAPITINPNERVASIMLGSQASTDAAKYIKHLREEAGMDKIFVFCGNNSDLKAQINTLVEQDPELKSRVYCLGNQKDEFICSLESRCQILVTRAGGLSVMEKLAMPRPTDQIILIHHSDSPDGKLKSGIIWEDKNADRLIAELHKSNIRTFKTCPSQVAELLRKRKHGEEIVQETEEFYDHFTDILPLFDEQSWYSIESPPASALPVHG